MAIVLRFCDLAHQSLWYDEGATVAVLRQPWLHGFLHQIAHAESAPPLYYAVAKLGTEVFGLSTFWLRAPSALAGVLTVPVAFALGTEVWDRRAGLLAAGVVAIDPELIWYSQEARCYALLVLFCGATALCLLRYRRTRSAVDLGLWWATAGLALLTHYYAGFLVFGEAAWLLWSAPRRRDVVLAAAGLVLLQLLLVPLIVVQLHTGNTAFINATPIDQRLGQSIYEAGTLGTGFEVSALQIRPPAVCGAAGLVGVALCLMGALRADPDRRRRLSALTALMACAVLVPLVVGILGAGGFYDRNLLGLAVPFLVVLAAGCLSLPRLGAAAAVGLLAASCLAVDVATPFTATLQRPPWQQAACFIRTAHASTVLLSQEWQDIVLAIYLPRLSSQPLNRPTSNLAIVAYGYNAAFWPARIGAFRTVSRRQDGTLALIDMTAATPQRLSDQFVARTQFRATGGQLFFLH